MLIHSRAMRTVRMSVDASALETSASNWVLSHSASGPTPSTLFGTGISMNSPAVAAPAYRPTTAVDTSGVGTYRSAGGLSCVVGQAPLVRGDIQSHGLGNAYAIDTGRQNAAGVAGTFAGGIKAPGVAAFKVFGARHLEGR